MSIAGSRQPFLHKFLVGFSRLVYGQRRGTARLSGEFLRLLIGHSRAWLMVFGNDFLQSDLVSANGSLGFLFHRMKEFRFAAAFLCSWLLNNLIVSLLQWPLGTYEHGKLILVMLGI